MNRKANIDRKAESKEFAILFGIGLTSLLAIGSISEVINHIMQVDSSKFPFSIVPGAYVGFYWVTTVRLSQSNQLGAHRILLAISGLGYAALLAFLTWIFLGLSMKNW